MSSSERVLLPAGAALEGAPTMLSLPERPLDDATAALLERERDVARSEGHAAGVERGRSELDAAARSLGAALGAALDELHVTVRQQHAALAAAAETRVLAAARAVLGEEPTEGRRVAAAVAAAVARVESTQVQVRVPEELVTLVGTALEGRDGLVLVADPTLSGEDVRVVAPDAEVDLRRERLLAALDDVLAAGPPLGPLEPPPGAGRAGTDEMGVSAHVDGVQDA